MTSIGSLEAREGRSKQRYEFCPDTRATLRLVVGCVPYRWTSEDSEEGAIGLDILLINSRKHPEEWVLPKGGWETDESLEDCATRETWEEAGCIGLLGDSLVRNARVSGGKQQQLHTYFALEIVELKEAWPEVRERRRQFFPVTRARELLTAQERGKGSRTAMAAAVDILEQCCLLNRDRMVR